MTRRTTIRWTGAAVAALLLAVLHPVSTTAAPTWLQPPTPVSDPSFTSFDQQVVVDALGNATAVWTTYIPAAGGTPAHYVITSAYLAAGGTWSAPVQVSPAADEVTDSEFPDIAVAGNGTVTAVWNVGRSPGPWAVKSASRAPGGPWTGASTVSTGSTFFPLPDVAADPAGDATVVWRQYGGAVPVALQASTKAAGASTWPPGVELDVPSTSTHDVAAGPDGTFVAVWSAVAGGVAVIRARARPPGGGWAPATTLTAPGAGNASGAVIAGSASGRFTVVWQMATMPNVYVVQSSGRGLDGSWSPAVDLSTASQYEATPSVALDPAGSATAAWRRYDGISFVVRASYQPAGSSWSPAVDISAASGNINAVTVGMDASGGARAAWSGQAASSWTVRASGRSAGGSWTPEVPLSAPTANGISPDLAVDPAGNAFAVWQASDQPGAGVVDALVLDGAGPTITGLTAPATGLAGSSLSYAATATDTWSGVAGYTWSFGDGSTATGLSVSHTYSALGSHPVTLTVTDAVGNATTRTATTTVAAPVPLLGLFKLKKQRIATDEKTKLKVRLNTAATLKLVFKSKHKHLVKGKQKYVRVVLRKQLPAGLSKITIKGKVKGIRLKPDTYRLTGSATNVSGTSPKKKVRLVVVRP